MANEKINAILASVSQRVGSLISFGRGYTVLYDQRRNELSFFLFPGGEHPHWKPRLLNAEPMLPDLVISGTKNVLYDKDLASRLIADKICYWPVEEAKVEEKGIPHSWLGVPMISGENVIGALVVESWQKTYSFSKSDEDTLSTVARQATMAIENARLFEQLERKVENLRILNEFGQKLATGLVKEEEKILELVYETMQELEFDLRNVNISFYYPDSNKPDSPDRLYGTLRFAVVYEYGNQVYMPPRSAQNGLTENVIRTKKSYYPPNVQKATEELNPNTNRMRRSRSWLGVPMLSDGQIFGVVVLRDMEKGNAFLEEEQEILEILANQAGVAVQNLRLYQAQQREQEKRLAAENMAVMSIVAAEFAHKMNNLAGTIPVRIKLAKAQLDSNNSRDAKIIENLTKIEKEADEILRAAQEIRQSSESGLKEDPIKIHINELLEIAIARARNNQNVENEIEIKKIYADNLPLLKAERNSFLDTLTSIIKNGFEAIDAKGSVTITTQLCKERGEDAIEIDISDTGKGIEPSVLSKIFDLFYTTKPEKGLGYGLWRDKIFIKKLGGDIDVISTLNKGTTMKIKIPITK
jgi:GAF domain-containing protein